MNKKEIQAVLDELQNSKLSKLSDRQLDSYQNRSNVHSDETKAKIGAAQKGMAHSAETKAKMSAAKKGKKPSEESKAKMSAAQKGKPAHNKGKTTSEETKAKRATLHNQRLLKTPKYIFVAKHIKKSKEDIVQLFMKEFKSERQLATTKVRGLIKKYHEINPESMT